MAFSDAIGLLFSIKADSKQASDEVSSFRKTVDKETSAIKENGKNIFTDFGQGLGLSAEKTAALSTALPILGTAIAGISSAAVGAAAGLFALAKNTSDYGSEIHDAAEATNFSTETLSALKLAADQSGSSLEAVSGGLGKFTKLLGQANDGNKTAVATLKEYGLTAQTALRDPEAALQKVIARLYELKGTQDQVILTQRTFGKGAADLIPVINTTNGNLAEYIENGKKLGLVLSQTDADAADAFGDSLGELQQSIRGVSQTFDREFLPDITQAMGSLEKLLLDNKSKFKEWGEYVGDIIRGISTPDTSYEAAVKKANEQATAKKKELPVIFGLPSDEDVINSVKDFFKIPVIERGRNLRQQENRQTQGILEGEYRDPNYGQPVDNADAKGVSPDTTRAKKEADSAERKAAAAKKKALEAETKTWNARSLAAFAEANGFKPGSGFVEGGHNPNSLHYLNRALDVGLGASNSQKTTAEIVALMAKALESGIRVVDERLKPKPGAVWTGRHVHLEENDKKGSFFNPNLDYGGQLEYLKALDKDRLAGKGRSVADALKTDPAQENEKAVKNREQTEQRILEIYKTYGAETKATLDNQLAQKLISEKDYSEKVAQLGINDLQAEKQLLEERLEMTELSAEQRADAEQKLSLLNSQIRIANTEKATDAIKKQNEEIENQKQFVDELTAAIARQYEEQLALEKQRVESENQLTDFRKEQERKGLQNDVDFSTGKKRLDAMVILREFDIAESDRKAKRAIAGLDAEQKKALADIDEKAEKETETTESVEKKKAEIRAFYANQKGLVNQQNQGEKDDINDSANPGITNQSAEVQAGPFFGAITEGIAGYLKNVALVEDANGKMQFSFSQMFDTIGGIGLQAFSSLADGFGQMVGNWVLYGNTGGQTLQKLAAQIFSQVASVATSYAVISLGAAALATTAFGAVLLGGTPGQFLAAAAIFGGIALGSALIGRGIAGDSFSKNTSADALTSGNSAGASGTGSNAADGKTTIEQNKIDRQESTSVNNINFRFPKGMIDRHVMDDFNRLGPIRNATLKLIEEN